MIWVDWFVNKSESLCSEIQITGSLQLRAKLLKLTKVRTCSPIRSPLVLQYFCKKCWNLANSMWSHGNISAQELSRSVAPVSPPVTTTPSRINHGRWLRRRCSRGVRWNAANGYSHAVLRTGCFTHYIWSWLGGCAKDDTIWAWGSTGGSGLTAASVFMAVLASQSTDSTVSSQFWSKTTSWVCS